MNLVATVADELKENPDVMEKFIGQKKNGKENRCCTVQIERHATAAFMACLPE